MARKKKQDDGGGGLAPWMATFSDLMNLLLCFFVLLFSMSTVDTEKFEDFVASLQSSFSIFEGGSSAISEGELISSGVSQLNELNDYINNMGTNPDEESDINEDTMGKYEEYKNEQMLEQSGMLGDQLEDQLAGAGLAGNGDYDIEIHTQYVKLTINGALLFNSGSAELRESSYEFVDKLGDVLKNYSDYKIEIIGHTDNVPMSPNKKFADNWELSQGRSLTVLKYLIDVKDIPPQKLSSLGKGEYEPIASNDTAEGRAQNRRVEIKIYNELSQITN